MNIAFNSLTPLCTERVYHKSLEEYLLAPISASGFIIGKIFGGSAARAYFVVNYCGAGMAFWRKTCPYAFVYSNLALNCVIFAEAGFCAALIVRNFEDMARFNTYLLLPMSFLCGTFFKTDRLPHAAAFVIELLPLTHASSLLRAINSGAPFSITSAAILLVYAVLLFGACHYIYKGLKKTIK